MGTQYEARLNDDGEFELQLDCSRTYCDCLDCEAQDSARRERVRAFAERWFCDLAGTESSGVRETPAAQTVRPPRMTRNGRKAA